MRNKLLFILFLAFMFMLTACSGSGADDPGKAAAAYWQALADKDAARLSNLSCSAFEAEALTTLESFRSIEVTLANLTCTAVESGDTADVSCTGTFTASYGAENLVIDLSQRTYSLVKEGGDWRMCGAK